MMQINRGGDHADDGQLSLLQVIRNNGMMGPFALSTGPPHRAAGSAFEIEEETTV